VTYDETMTTLLERSLQATIPQSEIINLGVPGFEPEHELDMMQQLGIQFGPDLVLLNFFIGNDIMRKRGAGRYVPFIVAGNSYYVHSNGNWIHDHWGLDRWYLYHHLNYLIRVELASFRQLFQKREVAIRNMGPALAPERWTLNYTQYLTERTDIFTMNETPEWDYHWRHTSETLDSLVEYLQARHILLLIVLIPEKVQLDEELQCQFLLAMNDTPAKYDFDKPQQWLREWCVRHSLVCVDLLSTWRQSTHTTTFYFSNDAHWTREGHTHAASATLPVLYKTLVHETASRESEGMPTSSGSFFGRRADGS
jgi:hypothetical protein